MEQELKFFIKRVIISTSFRKIACLKYLFFIINMLGYLKLILIMLGWMASSYPGQERLTL